MYHVYHQYMYMCTGNSDMCLHGCPGMFYSVSRHACRALDGVYMEVLDGCTWEHWMDVHGGGGGGGRGTLDVVHGEHWVSGVHIGALDGEHSMSVHAWPSYVPFQLHGPWFQSNSSRPWFQSNSSRPHSQHYMQDTVTWENSRDRVFHSQSSFNIAYKTIPGPFERRRRRVSPHNLGCITGYQVIRVIRIFAKTYPFE